MDFLKKFADTSLSNSKDDSPAEKSPEKTPPAEAEQSKSDLMADAKLVADAARSTFNKETPKYENSKVAGAAADLLDAAQEYGKLDEASGVGSYIEKAENYLHDYEAKNTEKPREAAPAPTPSEEPKKEEGEAKPSEPEPEPAAKKEEETEPAKKEEEGEKDFAKIAEGGLSKLAGGFKF